MAPTPVTADRLASLEPVSLAELFAAAIALVLIFEGLLPFISPALWRRVFERALQLNDGQIRMFGLTSLLIGVGLLLVFGP